MVIVTLAAGVTGLPLTLCWPGGGPEGRRRDLKSKMQTTRSKHHLFFSNRLNARFCRELKNTFDDLTVLRWLLCGARRAAAALSLALCKCSENRRKNKCSLVLFGLYPMICDFWFTLYTWVHSSEPETVKTNVGAGRANCLLALNSSNGLHIHYLLAQCCLSAMKTFYSLVEILSSEEECD